MELLIDKGDFEIIAYTENAEDVIKKCGCTCYQSEQRTVKSSEEFVRMLREKGHWSMFDHCSISVWFKNVSRGFLAEITRHRLCAFSAESTRFVDPTEDPLTGKPGVTNLKVVLPPHRNLSERLIIKLSDLESGVYDAFLQDRDDHDYSNCVLDIPISKLPLLYEIIYSTLRQYHNWNRDDARQFLPIGTKSDIVMTADFTEWRHVLRLRTQKAAHWEIRTVMCKLLLAFQELFPSVFEDFVKAGEDKNGVSFYKIKGYTGDLTEVIDGYKGTDLQEFKEYLTKKINE